MNRFGNPFEMRWFYAICAMQSDLDTSSTRPIEVSRSLLSFPQPTRTESIPVDGNGECKVSRMTLDPRAHGQLKFPDLDFGLRDEA
jgi:hypothetical protein